MSDPGIIPISNLLPKRKIVTSDIDRNNNNSDDSNDVDISNFVGSISASAATQKEHEAKKQNNININQRRQSSGSTSSSLNSTLNSSSSAAAALLQKNRPKAIHIFPPSEAQHLRFAKNASSTSNSNNNNGKNVKNSKNNNTDNKNSSSSAIVMSSIDYRNLASNLEKEANGELTASSLLPLSHVALQTVIDNAKDGDCVYIQPGIHELRAPLYISDRKKIYILGFVESHTESEPPTLRMKVTAPSNKGKHSVLAANLLLASAQQQKNETSSAASSNSKTTKNFTTANEAEAHAANLLAGSDSLKKQPIKPMIRIQEGSEVFFSHMRFEYIVEYADEVEIALSQLSSSHHPTTSQEILREQQQREQDEKLEKEKENMNGKEKEERPTLPLNACAMEITGAATQVTMNHCTILSNGHGIRFRCTATSIGATHSFVSSPRLALRDQCFFECPVGTCLIVEAQDSGFASHQRVEAMNAPKSDLRPPEGVVNITKCFFVGSQCGAELSGPLHVKITDSEFEQCQIGISAVTCMQMHLQINDTLFQKCQGLACALEAPKGAGSSRDISFHDTRFDQNERALTLQGPDCTATVDACFFTRNFSCGVLLDGGKTSFTNCVFQQNDVGCEIIDGKPLFLNNTFHGNVAAAALICGNGTTPTFRENTFTNTGEGGAVSVRSRLNRRQYLDTILDDVDEGNVKLSEQESKYKHHHHHHETSGATPGVDDISAVTINNSNSNISTIDEIDENEFNQSRINDRYQSNNNNNSQATTSLNAHRRSVRCAAIFIEQDATPLIEFNRFENNYGANILVANAGLGVYTDNAFGQPSTDSYNIVISGLRSNPKIHFNVIIGNEKGQARPTVVVEDGASADVQLNDFVKGSSSAVLLRRSGDQTIVAQNRVSSQFLEGIVVLERARGMASRNNLKGLSVEVFSDSKETFRLLS